MPMYRVSRSHEVIRSTQSAKRLNKGRAFHLIKGLFYVKAKDSLSHAQVSVRTSLLSFFLPNLSEAAAAFVTLKRVIHS